MMMLVRVAALPCVLALALPPPPFRSGQRGPPLPGGEHVAFEHHAYGDAAASAAARQFLSTCATRRTVRFFDSAREPELSVLEDCVAAAATAPSGAHQQPWHYVVVRDPATRAAIRALVEKAEATNYAERMSRRWKDELQPLMSALHGPGETVAPEKPYLTEAPYVVLVFAQKHGVDAEGAPDASVQHYYVSESMGISLGIFVTALHHASLCSLISTPMGAGAEIARLLGRPANERLFALLPVGFPRADATVPYRVALRKPLAEVLTVV